MRFVLDTNTFSALMRGDPPMVGRIAQIPPEDVAVPQPVIAEIAYGIARLPSSRRRDWLMERFAQVASELPRAIWSDDVSHAYGRLKAALERRGRRIEDFDAAIAAHALAAGAVLVTTDTAHMTRIEGLRIEDWSQPQVPP
jgi:tRNA(fMet)-specific endonuclease VapC